MWRQDNFKYNVWEGCYDSNVPLPLSSCPPFSGSLWIFPPILVEISPTLGIAVVDEWCADTFSTRKRSFAAYNITLSNVLLFTVLRKRGSGIL